MTEAEKSTATAIATVFSRRHPELLPKDFGKMRDAVESHFISDLCDRAGLLLQQLRGALEADIADSTREIGNIEWISLQHLQYRPG